VNAAVADAGDDVVQMAFQLADSAARSDIECIGRSIKRERVDWYDLQGLDEEDHAFVTFALRYMQGRGDALPYRLIAHPNFPFLWRFEDRQ
jgi:hypothetical protein